MVAFKTWAEVDSTAEKANSLRGRREPGRGEHPGSKERQGFRQGGGVHRMESSCESTDKGPLAQAEQFQRVVMGEASAFHWV